MVFGRRHLHLRQVQVKTLIFADSGRKICVFSVNQRPDFESVRQSTLFFSLFITWLFQRGFSPNSNMQKYNVVPFGGWLFDLLENLGIVSMLSVFPSTPAALAWITAIFTLIKWSFAGASVVFMLIGLVKAAMNGFNKQA